MIRGLRLAVNANVLSPLVMAVMLLMIDPAGVFSQSLDHDSNQPIEISADSLEVAQEEQIATFAGNVDAVQGDLVLSADRLKVYYEGKSSSIGLAAGSGSAIRQIDAEGNVILSSPEETAEGDHGTYDVSGKLVTLKGEVVLTRGANVIRGDHLEMDLVSGKSRIVGAEATVADDAPNPSSGRVKALFTPQSKDEGNEDEPASEGQTQ